MAITLTLFNSKGDVTREKTQYVWIGTRLCLGIDDRRLMVNLASDKIFKTELKAYNLCIEGGKHES